MLAAASDMPPALAEARCFHVLMQLPAHAPPAATPERTVFLEEWLEDIDDYDGVSNFPNICEALGRTDVSDPLNDWETKHVRVP